QSKKLSHNSFWKFFFRFIFILNSLKNIRWSKKAKKFISYYDLRTNNDKWVIDVLNGKKNGFFIEAGADDGLSCSSTYSLEKYLGWKGILVEPSLLYNQLKNNRQSICINKILSDKNDFEKFMFLPMQPLFSCTKVAFVQNKRKIINAHKKKDFPIEETNLECISLYSLLNMCKAPKIIDYLALDVEGSELKVLRKFPFEKYNIRCISVEGHECDSLLESKGYNKVSNKYNKKSYWESYFVKE
ncbi:MAG: FkbM family methyltransferase, partial [Nanoarchaeota archaeon]|nr:FkbM family methyltransferase [Nanoarchaeota archaeon]MBU1604580.1 FkbM family methyltransferase [Nanoarchaeota archaeon]